VALLDCTSQIQNTEPEAETTVAHHGEQAQSHTFDYSCRVIVDTFDNNICVGIHAPTSETVSKNVIHAVPILLHAVISVQLSATLA
jgi:hypothetical protein